MHVELQLERITSDASLSLSSNFSRAYIARNVHATHEEDNIHRMNDIFSSIETP